MVKLIQYYSGVAIAVFCILNRDKNLNKIEYTVEASDFAKNNFNSIEEIWSLFIYSLISKDIPSFNKDKCPICNKNMTNS